MLQSYLLAFGINTVYLEYYFNRMDCRSRQIFVAKIEAMESLSAMFCQMSNIYVKDVQKDEPDKEWMYVEAKIEDFFYEDNVPFQRKA